MTRAIQVFAAYLVLAAAAAFPSDVLLSKPPDVVYAVIVNRKNPIDNLAAAELRRIFLGQQNHWPGGRQITLVLPARGSGQRRGSLKLIAGVDDGEFAKRWLHAAFRGEDMGAPREMDSAAGVRRFVFNAPGAVGYVPIEEVDESVKIVSVDSRMPGDPLYPFRESLR